MTNFAKKIKMIAVAALFAIGTAAFAISGFFEVPDTVTDIGYGAYRNRKDLILVNIPYSVTSINKNAFMNCPNLRSITFDDEDNWFITQDEQNWQNKTMGTRFDVSDSSTNATAFRSGRYFFYKLVEEE